MTLPTIQTPPQTALVMDAQQNQNRLGENNSPQPLQPMPDLVLHTIQQSHTEGAGTKSEFANPLVTIRTNKPVEFYWIVPDPKLQRIVTRLLQCSAFRQYWEQMLQEGMLHIRYATPFDTMMGPAMTFTNRTIVLQENMPPDELVYSIVFELGNLPQVKNLRGVLDFSSADDFALNREDLEYETWITVHHLSSHLLAEGFLPRQEYPYLTKEEYLALQESSGHTDLYRGQWYEACDPEAGRAWYAANLPKWEKILQDHPPQ